MSCTPYDLEVKQYATFKMTITLTDQTGSYLDITSWSFSGSIKHGFKDDNPITSFSCDVTSLPSATVLISLLPSQTALLSKASYKYDIIAANVSPNPDEVYRLMEGAVNVCFGVTETS